MADLKLFLFGPPRIELNGAPVDIQRRKAVAILVYLAVSEQAHSREALATFFWPDLDPQRSRAYLRRDLAEINTNLPGNWLIADRETVELNRRTDLWLDSGHFQRLVAACQAHGHPPEIVRAECIYLLTEAVALYSGDFLAGFTLRDSREFDEWQFFQMESLRQGLATVLERLVRGLIALSRALNHRMEIHATRCLEGLAELASAKGEPQQALAYSEQLWTLAEQYDLREIMARALRWRGVALLALGQFEPAAMALQQALEMAEVSGRIRLVWQIHEALAQLYRAQKQEEKASEHDGQVQKIVHRIAANLQEAELRAGLPLASIISGKFDQSLAT